MPSWKPVGLSFVKLGGPSRFIDSQLALPGDKQSRRTAYRIGAHAVETRLLFAVERS